MAQFYTIATKSTVNLQRATQIIKTFEDLCNPWASEIAKQDPASYYKLRDLRKQHEGLQLTIQRLQIGVDTTVEEFQQAQGIDNDTEMEIIEDATLAVVGEHNADGGNNADTEMEKTHESLC